MYIVEQTFTGASQGNEILVADSRTIKFELQQTAANIVVAEGKLTSDGVYTPIGIFNVSEISMSSAINSAGLYEIDIENLYSVRFAIDTFIGGTIKIISKVVN